MKQTKPIEFQNIPLELRVIPRWVLWKYMMVKNRETKVPVQIDGAMSASNNPATWVDFHTAEKAYRTGNFSGIGFVFTQEDDLCGIDLDDCIIDGQLTDFAKNIIDNVQGYVEVSPSGTGVKIFTRSDVVTAHVDHSKGLEVYGTGRYFTVTGNYLSGAIPTEQQDLTAYIPERTIKKSGDAFADYTPPVEGYDIHRVETEILSNLSPNCHYSEWLLVGQCLHHQFGGDIEALQLWDRWSDSDGTGEEYEEGACEDKWGTFKGSGATLRSLIFKVNKAKREEALARGEVVLGNEPIEHSTSFLGAVYSCPEGTSLVHYADEFYEYVNTHYNPIEEATVRSDLYKYLNKCKKQDRKGNIISFAPNPANVSATLDATKALTHLQNVANTKPPVWLDGYADSRPDADKLVSLKNGLFNVEDGILLPHSLGFFTTNSLPFNYDPTAKCPQWLNFLNDIWGDDEESKNLLQEYFAYVLTGDTRQQKFLNIIGPRRSGKGTINKILVSLLGEHNTISPQLDEMVGTFGLQPWLNKLLASITDARITNTRNTGGIVSQLLRIVGGDTITVDRKNKESWSGYLPTRIIIYSNEALQLSESSNALTGRMLVLSMHNSFFGKEDVTLSDRLATELSGIFNWALEGNQRRLARDGQRFIQPKSGIELLTTMEELSNPMITFFEDALVFDDKETVRKDHLFAIYTRWCTKHGMQSGNELSFKRKFIASTQDKGITSAKTAEGRQGRKPCYVGVGLNDMAKEYIDKQAFFDLEEGGF